MKNNMSEADIAQQIFDENPDVSRVYVVGEFGFVDENAAKNYANKELVIEVLRKGKNPEPTYIGALDTLKRMNKDNLLKQADLRGMTLDKALTKVEIIEELTAYDDKLKRESEEANVSEEKKTEGDESLEENESNINE